jgi:hypothetical protein
VGGVLAHNKEKSADEIRETQQRQQQTDDSEHVHDLDLEHNLVIVYRLCLTFSFGWIFYHLLNPVLEDALDYFLQGAIAQVS